MKRMFVWLICVGILLTANQGFARTLELVTLQYPPYEYEENGEIIGIAVEIVKEAFKRMDQPIMIKLFPWARALKMIKYGNADAIFTAYKNPEREQFADYSKEVLMPQIVSLFVLKDSPIVFDGDLRKLSKYSFGAVIRVSYGKKFDGAVKNKILTKIERVNTGEQNIIKLLNGRVDIIVSHKLGALSILKKMNKLNAVNELLPELEMIPSYIAFSKKRNLSTIRDEFDIVIREMKEDGTYDRIINMYLH